MYRERDPLLELWKREHERVIARIRRVAMGDEGKRALDDIAVQLRSLAAAEAAVLGPAFVHVSLPVETQHLLEDCRGDHDLQQAAIAALKRALRSPSLRKVRALQLVDLIASHAERYAARLIPILASQLPRPLYRAISNTFASCHDAHGDAAPHASARLTAVG